MTEHDTESQLCLWPPGSALPLLDEGCRTHTSAKTLYSHCVWAQATLHHDPEPNAACSQPGLLMTYFSAPMSSKYPIKHHNCPHSSSCDSVSIHDPLILPEPYKETGMKTIQLDVNYRVSYFMTYYMRGFVSPRPVPLGAKSTQSTFCLASGIGPNPTAVSAVLKLYAYKKHSCFFLPDNRWCSFYNYLSPQSLHVPFFFYLEQT